MPDVIGVRFRGGGKAYHFSPGDHAVQRGEAVIVETFQGVELGIVSEDIIDLSADELVAPLKEILRVATPEDLAQYEANNLKEIEAFQICKEKIEKRGLEMQLVNVEYTFDGHKIIFYFTADGRVDFRELVKDLASQFRTRIELRQIGVRDEARMIGGLGICGRELCCSSFLQDFVPVSIKMAKAQNLSMNPAKISGNCGLYAQITSVSLPQWKVHPGLLFVSILIFRRPKVHPLPIWIPSAKHDSGGESEQ